MGQASQLITARLKKLEAIKSRGIEPYGGKFKRTHDISRAIGDFEEGLGVCVAGRMMAVRSHGKSAFADLRDSSGKVQLYLKADVVGEEAFDLFGQTDIGDILGVEGSMFKTKMGEVTVKVSKFTILAKNLRPLPEKWHGLKDVETRFRQRYVDLIMNSEVKEIFILRGRMITSIRDFLDARGYLEVETPICQPIPGGASGKPFKTYHEALDMELYLRIAPELYLKKLLVGGFEKVYEVNKSFRNEGISTRHNPEFTMLEVYTAYQDCEDAMRLTEQLITHLARELKGTTKFEYRGEEVDLSSWERESFAQLMKDKYDIRPDEGEEVWMKKLKKAGVKIEGEKLSRTQAINIIGDIIEPKAKGHPVFVIDLFTELCPLAKAKRDNPLLTERFELYIGGLEVANGYSELNDPIEQRKRFEEQVRMGAAQRIDEDFVRALEYGMPPAGGFGIGIDRLAMIFANRDSIRDVILFPQLKARGDLS